MLTQPHRRAAFIGFALAAIALGLGIHSYGTFLGPTARDVAGDALWAAMIAAWIGALVPGASMGARLAAAMTICVAVEMSQLYHGVALDSVRRTTAGQLVLGSGFDRRDFAAYALGLLVAALAERLLFQRVRDGRGTTLRDGSAAREQQAGDGSSGDGAGMQRRDPGR